jgi:hypothetical protein
MEVEVHDILPTILAAIDYQSITRFRTAQLASHGADDAMQMPHKCVVFITGIFQADDRFLGDHQNVDGSLRVDIVEGKCQFIFVDNLGRDFLPNDFREYRLHAIDSPLSQVSTAGRLATRPRRFIVPSIGGVVDVSTGWNLAGLSDIFFERLQGDPAVFAILKIEPKRIVLGGWLFLCPFGDRFQDLWWWQVFLRRW